MLTGWSENAIVYPVDNFGQFMAQLVPQDGYGLAPRLGDFRDATESQVSPVETLASMSAEDLADELEILIVTLIAANSGDNFWPSFSSIAKHYGIGEMEQESPAYISLYQAYEIAFLRHRTKLLLETALKTNFSSFTKAAFLTRFVYHTEVLKGVANVVEEIFNELINEGIIVASPERADDNEVIYEFNQERLAAVVED